MIIPPYCSTTLPYWRKGDGYEDQDCNICGFLVACLGAIPTTPTMARQTVVVKHPPIVGPADVSLSWSAGQNVIESKQYERLLATNPAFRLQSERAPRWFVDPGL